MALNMLDFLLVLLVVLGTLAGMLQGVGKQLIGLFSLYLSLVVAFLLYRPFTRFLHELLAGMTYSGAQTLAFCALLLVATGLVSLLTQVFTRLPEERKRKNKRGLQEETTWKGGRFLLGSLNQLGGLLLGFTLTVVWVSLALAVLGFITDRGGGPASAIGASLGGHMHTSTLVPLFDGVLLRLYRLVAFWLPADQAPALFARVLG